MVNDRRTLQRAFGDVRKIYFPRWDLRGQWAVKKVRHLPVSAPVIAYTNHSLKTIFINYLPKSKDNLYSLLIHEICHGITSGQHKKGWRNRILKAAGKARKIGNARLVKKILMDIDKIKGVSVGLKR